jgi:hypothetical protein
MSHFDFLEGKTKGQAHSWAVSTRTSHFDFLGLIKF